MKLEKITHDHLLTKWLKVIIFALLMLAPIFSIAVRCAYVVCNKNAYQSYSGNEKQINYINIENNTPQYDCYLSFGTLLPLNDFSNTNNYFYVTNVKYISGNLNTTQQENLNNASTIRIWRDGNNFINFGDGNLSAAIYNFVFKCDISTYATSTANNNILNSIFYKIIETNGLDNVFDYSVNQLRNDQLFNWTQNTGIYTGVNAMTTGLGMTDGTIAILLTYWMLLTIIYVIIDIVLAGFTMLTHMIYNKKAE